MESIEALALVGGYVDDEAPQGACPRIDIMFSEYLQTILCF